MKFIIPLPPVTKKNHSQIIINPRTKKPMVIPSKQYLQYEKSCKWFLPKVKTINEPIQVKCLFYRKTKRKGDLVGYLQAIDDILVKYGIISDDNCDIVVSHDGSRVLYDKDNPRTEIKISKQNEVKQYERNGNIN